MALPAPNLDDRRFQNLVDDAKRLVQRRCPEWTDHNVSDPGVTLIETFAYMTDQLLYRLNRVPDRNYIKFLELIGVRLFPPTAATTRVTFWLSAPQETTVVVPARGRGGHAADRSRPDSAIAFTTTDILDIVPCEMTYIASIVTGGTWRNHTDAIRLSSFSCFSPQPVPDEVLLIGLSTAVPRCAVSLRFDCTIEGIGVDPDWPPLAWEAYDGASWVTCEVDKDTTGGLNRPGEVVLHVPPTHVMSLEHQLRAGWLRARLTTPEEDQPFYSNSPLIKGLEVRTVGGTIESVQAEVIEDEVVGLSEGVPGQRFEVARKPVVPSGEPVVLEVSDEEEGWQEWSEVSDFAQSRADDRHFVLDAVGRRGAAGPRRADAGRGASSTTAPFRPRARWCACAATTPGGGRQGNVTQRAIRVCRTTIPYVARVENRYPATGGVDGEDVEEAKIRGPIVMRTLGRAVTAEDYEQLAKEAAPEAARVRAVPAATDEEAGGVRVLIVPAVADDENGRLSFEPAGAARRRRSATWRPSWTPAGPSGRGSSSSRPPTRASPWWPCSGPAPGPIRAGCRGRRPTPCTPTCIPSPGAWMGRDGTSGDPSTWVRCTPCSSGCPGPSWSRTSDCFAANPITGQRGQAAQRVEVAANALVFSYEHQVRVEEL